MKLTKKFTNWINQLQDPSIAKQFIKAIDKYQRENPNTITIEGKSGTIAAHEVRDFVNWLTDDTLEYMEELIEEKAI